MSALWPNLVWSRIGRFSSRVGQKPVFKASGRFVCFSKLVVVVRRWRADILDRRTETRRCLVLRNQLGREGGAGPRRHTCVGSHNMAKPDELDQL